MTPKQHKQRFIDFFRLNPSDEMWDILANILIKTSKDCTPEEIVKLEKAVFSQQEYKELYPDE